MIFGLAGMRQSSIVLEAGTLSPFACSLTFNFALIQFSTRPSYTLFPLPHPSSRIYYCHNL